MGTVVALWAPEITPPDEWLIPAILYQDRIATFAPHPYLRDTDGQEARRLERLLGELYEPLHFDTVEDPSLCGVLQGRIPLWLKYAQSRLGQAPDPVLSEWVSRARGWHDRLILLHDLYEEAIEELRSARRALAEAKANRESVLFGIAADSPDLEHQIKILRRQLREEYLAREEVLAPLKAQRKSLRPGRRGRCADADARLRAVDAEIRALSTSLRSASQVRDQYNALLPRYSNSLPRRRRPALHLGRRETMSHRQVSGRNDNAGI
jgi:hypothetical protein